MGMENLFKSYAKINLFLKIGKKVPSGYHQIETVMQCIDLFDILGIEAVPDDRIIIQTKIEELRSKDNLVYRAAELVKKEFGISGGVMINLEKNIPLASGLAGGSSNAATTLLALNKLWKLKLPYEKLVKLAIKLGSDVPFFLTDDAALVTGIGDKIEPVKKPHKMNVILINPGFKIETKNVYKWYDAAKRKSKKKPSVQGIVGAMEKNNIDAFADSAYNDFDDVLCKKYPILKEIKTNLLRNRALNASISGSGPTVFGVFSSIYTAREAYYELKDSYPFVFLTKTI